MISENLRRLRDLRDGEAALRYMKRHQQDHLARYPQLCCIAFDHVGLTINVTGRYDKEKLAFVARHLRAYTEGRTVCDVGANIGNHALAFAEHAGQVVAFEPHPFTFRLLELNSRLAPNVIALNLGASDADGVVKAVTPRDNFGGSAISDDAAAQGEVFEFKVVRLDTLPELQNVDIGLMKVDVEGHEPQALRGAEGLLRKHQPVVILEQNRAAIANGTSESLELLRSVGYTHFYTVETALPWRSGKSLPRPLQRASRLFESVFRGLPDMVATATPIDRLRDDRDYDFLIASPRELTFT